MGVLLIRVTSSLTIDYADSAKLGDWIEIETDVQKVGNKMAFGNCYFIVFTFLIKKRIHVHKLTFMSWLLSTHFLTELVRLQVLSNG
jgi:acyl-coenzyme A thioesterase PaaI-like protein